MIAGKTIKSILNYFAPNFAIKNLRMKIILKYGLLAGAAIFVYIILELALGLHGKYLHIGQYTGYFRYFFLAAGIYVGINDLRHEPIGMVITYWSAVGKGLGISAVTAICVCIFEWLYIDFINPKFMQDFIKSFDAVRQDG